jgi:DHA1 family bicyclomycin/chloramphenicol resistance-like MFS transporter
VPVLALLSMLGPFSVDTYLPSFPAIAADLQTGLPAMAQTLSIYLLAFALVTLVWGPLSDAFGRKRVLLVSLAGYVLATIGCALADNLHELLLWRALQGMAACGGMVIGRAVVRDAYQGPDAQRVLAHVMMLFAVAPAIAPVLGGWLEQWLGWRSVFGFLVLYGLMLLMLISLRLPETHHAAARTPIHPSTLVSGYLTLLKNPRFLALVFTFSSVFGGLFLYISGSPAVIYDHLGMGEGDFGVFFIPTVVGMMTGSWLAGRAAHRWPPQRTVKAAYGVLFSAWLLNLASALWLPANPFTVVTPLVLFALGSSLMMPNLSLMALDCYPHRRGMAAAVQGFAQMGFMGLVAGVLMPLAAPSLVYFAAIQGLLLTASLGLWMGFGKEGLESNPGGGPV